MHPEAGCCVYFQDGTAVFGNGCTQIGGHDIYAADVETDDLGDPVAHHDIGRMHFIESHLGLTASLVEFVDESVTPENMLLIATLLPTSLR